MNSPNYIIIPQKTQPLVKLGTILLVYLVVLELASQFPEINLLVTRVLSPLFALYCLFLYVNKPVRLPPEFYLYGAFVVWCLSGFLVIVDNSAFMDSFTLIAQAEILFFCIAVLIIKVGTVRHLFLMLIANSILLILILLFFQNAYFDLVYTDNYRLDSIGANSNGIGFFFLTSVMGLAYFWRRHNSNFTQILIIMLLILFSLGIIVTASRKSFLVLLVFIILWVYFCYIRVNFKRPVWIIPVILLIFVLNETYDYVSTQTYLGQRLNQYDTVQDFADKNNRYTMMVESWSFFTKSPIIGLGLGHFRIFSITSQGAHGDYFEVLSTTGAVGTILYFSIYLVFYRRLKRLLQYRLNPKTRYELSLFQAILISLLLLGLGQSTFMNLLFLPILFGIMAHSYNIEKLLLKSLKEINNHNA